MKCGSIFSVFAICSDFETSEDFSIFSVFQISEGEAAGISFGESLRAGA